LAGCWLLSVALGGAAHIAPHWFYLPIMWAGMRFGRRGAALTASAALVIAGPLLPADVGTWAPQEVSDWVSRGVFFLGIGLVVAQLFVRLRQAGETDVHAAELRARLFAQARFQVLLETSSDVITVLDDDGSVVSRDGPVLAVFGDAAHPWTAAASTSCSTPTTGPAYNRRSPRCWPVGAAATPCWSESVTARAGGGTWRARSVTCGPSRPWAGSS